MNMKKYLLGVVATGVLAMAWSASASANLVSNGSFETLVGGQNLSGTYYEQLAPGSTRIADWTVSGAAGKSLDIVREGTGVTPPKSLDWAQDGEYGIDLAGNPGPAELSQSISTSSGQQYLVSFWTSSNGSATADALSVYWDNVLMVDKLDTTIQGTWLETHFTVFGTGVPMSLKFAGLLGGSAGALLDNVSVTAVPLPPAVILFGSVLFGFSVVARKRNRSALAA